MARRSGKTLREEQQKPGQEVLRWAAAQAMPEAGEVGGLVAVWPAVLKFLFLILRQSRSLPGLRGRRAGPVSADPRRTR